jgi:hypothetical protein
MVSPPELHAVDLGEAIFSAFRKIRLGVLPARRASNGIADALQAFKRKFLPGVR